MRQCMRYKKTFLLFFLLFSLGINSQRCVDLTDPCGIPLKQVINGGVIELNSKIDLLMDDEDCCRTVVSLVDVIESKVDIGNNEEMTIDSKVDKLLEYKGTIIPPCPVGAIDEPGLYTLSEDTTCCIQINADDVTIDLGGFTLTCLSGAAAIEILNGRKNIEIVNGKIKSNYDATSTDGISISSGSSFVTVDNVNIYSCDNGVVLNGTSGNDIRSCKFTDCIVQDCNKGFAGTYSIKSVFKDCEAFNCIQAGFDFVNSDFNIIDGCEALETLNTTAAERAIGFSSSQGIGNLFKECVAEGTTKTASTFGNGAIGFLLNGTEEETKIIDCVANSSIVQAGTAVAYGIYLESILVDGLLPTLTVAVRSDYTQGVSALDWSPNGKYLALGGTNDLITNADVVVSYFDGSTITDVAGENLNIGITNAIAWSNDGNYLAVGGTVGGDEFQVFRFDGSSLTGIGGATYGTVYSVAWHPNDRFIALGEAANLHIRGFDGNSLAGPVSLGLGGNVYSVDWSPDGRYLVAGTTANANEIQVFEYSGIVQGILPGPIAVYSNGSVGVNAVAWSPDGKYVAFGCDNSAAPEIRVLSFDGTAFAEISSFNHDANVNKVSWSPDGRYLVFASEAGTEEAEILRFDGAPLLTSVKQYPSAFDVLSIKWSRDGRYIAMGSANGAPAELQVFEVMEGPSDCLIDSNKACNGTASTAGSVGISGSGDNVYIRNVASGNTANFNEAVYNVYGDGLLPGVPFIYGGTYSFLKVPRETDNLWLPGFSP